MMAIRTDARIGLAGPRADRGGPLRRVAAALAALAVASGVTCAASASEANMSAILTSADNGQTLELKGGR